MRPFSYRKHTDDVVRRDFKIGIGLSVMWILIGIGRILLETQFPWLVAATFALAALFALQAVVAGRELRRRDAAFRERNAQMLREREEQDRVEQALRFDAVEYDVASVAAAASPGRDGSYGASDPSADGSQRDQ